MDGAEILRESIVRDLGLFIDSSDLKFLTITDNTYRTLGLVIIQNSSYLKIIIIITL